MHFKTTMQREKKKKEKETMTARRKPTIRKKEIDMGMDSKKRELINHVAQSISRTKTKKRRFENVGYKNKKVEK